MCFKKGCLGLDIIIALFSRKGLFNRNSLCLKSSNGKMTAYFRVTGSRGRRHSKSISA
ncbi:hypothetical protein DPMN_095277 [Dreissena polymorpha]|uniref:Uncharacterized protein n=1 Tax=Dreissena polymorpha TaxID=45954 RepID=A0A9D4L7K5_DREPO|nr:hypothetical protein DPMN_095277 [Dreissena polymorpha]